MVTSLPKRCSTSRSVYCRRGGRSRHCEEEATRRTLPADPEVKNFSYTVVDGEVFYRENSVMTQVELSDTAKGRVTGMVELRQIVNELIDQQLNDFPDEDIKQRRSV